MFKKKNQQPYAKQIKKKYSSSAQDDLWMNQLQIWTLTNSLELSAKYYHPAIC